MILRNEMSTVPTPSSSHTLTWTFSTLVVTFLCLLTIPPFYLLGDKDHFAPETAPLCFRSYEWIRGSTPLKKPLIAYEDWLIGTFFMPCQSEG